ncbi:hypothetical protein [Pseudomonas citronellolis]|uniref:hypothetical protein n=1 Tax=Pseudomonas citronellolis TaxID=53408 RepID=UPI002FDB9118
MTEHPRPLPAEPAEEFGERSYPVDEHMAGQRRAWRLERLGLAVLLGIVLVALSGLFASGPLSSRQLASQDGRLQVEYERFGRVGASHNLHVRLRGAPGSAAELRLGGDFLARQSVQSLQPMQRGDSWRGGLAIHGRHDERGEWHLFLTLLPDAPGLLDYRVEGAGQALEFNQLIYP